MKRFVRLIEDIRACELCSADLPLGPRPVLQAHPSARILIVGQAPGTAVHRTGIPFNDPSGDRLRDWLGVSRETFYDPRQIALLPMGFCYPGKGPGGALPPRPPSWAVWGAPRDRAGGVLGRGGPAVLRCGGHNCSSICSASS